MGGGKGGSDFDPKGKSDAEIMRFCQSFMTELCKHIGQFTDVPAGDIGVGGREYRLYVRPVQASCATSTPAFDRQGPVLRRFSGTHAGNRLRPVLLHEEMLAYKGTSFEGKTVAISGSGNVAIYACEKATSWR